MSDFLHTMAARSAERAATVGGFVSGDFDKALVPLSLQSFDVIAELKDRSPAEGDLAGVDDRARLERAQCYVDGGAAAISVLTEPSCFAGSLEHLDEVAAAVPETPVMRKDFLVEPVQILEARKHGASGVLLIATMLPDAKLREMLDCAWQYRLFVLLESFDAADLARCSALLDNSSDQERARNGQLLVGVNTRNLRTLKVDPERLSKLAPALPALRCVAQSGLHAAADAARVAALGYTSALVGTALMRSDNPAALISDMRAAGAAELAP
jgi:indole-3-glycerol phosphate synthase